jgi:hypothetical protein
MTVDSQYRDFIEAVHDARAAADGDSNDDEIAALREAVDAAVELLDLSRVIGE